MKSPLVAAADAARTENDLAAHAELDRMLSYLKVVPAEGLEARIMARLEAESARKAVALTKAAPRSRGWVPVAIAASLVCVFAGGLLVARETPATAISQAHAVPAQMSAPQNVPEVRRGLGITAAAPSLRSMDTAAARRKPPARILVDRRRGRASTSAPAR